MTDLIPLVNAEIVHNWSQRYRATPWGMALPPIVRAALDTAHRAHHDNGADAQELANRLAEHYPVALTR